MNVSDPTHNLDHALASTHRFKLAGDLSKIVATMTAAVAFAALFAVVSISSGYLYGATVANFDGGADTPAFLHQFGGGPGPSIQPAGGNPGGFLRLTSATNQLHNLVTFDRTDSGMAVSSTFSFQFRITAGFGSADGFSFCYANTALYGTNGGIAGMPFLEAEDPAAPGILGFGFDTFSNQAPFDNPGAPLGDDYQEISLFYNGALVLRIDDTRFVPFLLDDGKWHSVIGTVNFLMGAVSLTVDGLPVFYNVTVPGLTSFESRVLLASRTGALNETADIDNLAVETYFDRRSIIQIALPTPSTALIQGAGTPFQNYSLETSADFVAWSWRANVVANAAGLWQFFDANVFAWPQRFYRLKGSPLPRGLVAWYRAEGNYNDSFGPHHGTPDGGLAFFGAGQRGQAFSFNGVDAAMVITNAGPIPAPWTAACWVKRLDTPDVSAALLADGATALKLEQWPLTRQVGFTQFGVADYAFDYIAPVGTWVHLTFVGTPFDTRLYVNGFFRQSLPVVISLPLQFLGRRDTGQERLLGLLDEIAIFNRQLSNSEIYYLRNATGGS